MSEVAQSDQNPSEEGPSDEGETVRDSRLKLAAAILCIVLPLGIFFAPWNIEPHTQTALAITAFMLLAWMT
ncbi:MAG: hypothetical protein ACKVG0_13895, partial [Alphaproteobacteria bacterium]